MVSRFSRPTSPTNCAETAEPVAPKTTLTADAGRARANERRCGVTSTVRSGSAATRTETATTGATTAICRVRLRCATRAAEARAPTWSLNRNPDYDTADPNQISGTKVEHFQLNSFFSKLAKVRRRRAKRGRPR